MSPMAVLLLLFACVAADVIPALPESILVQPIPRNNTNSTVANKPPCGGVAKGLSHTLAEPGSINPIAWSVKTASDLGNCTIRLSHTDFSHFKTIVPVDVEADSDGKFACGRGATYMEKHDIEFPSDFTCDECTLQWSWETEAGTYFQCVDVQISKGAVSACFGKCRNGGACVNDQCLCVLEYTGQYCESLVEAEVSSDFFSVFVLFLVVLLILILVAGGTFLYVQNVRLSRGNHLFFMRYLPWCMKNRNSDLNYWNDDGVVQSPNLRRQNSPPKPSESTV